MDEGDYVYDTTSAIDAPASSFTYAVAQPGNEGRTFRFRVAAVNALGTAVFSDEIQLVATDAPEAPTLDLLESSRTLTGFQLSFGRPASDGGSALIGYLLYRDEGIAGSPYTLIFNGTSKPEVTTHAVEGLETALTYRFQLFSLNTRFRSATPATLELLVGTLPGRPRHLRRLDAPFVPEEIPVEWDAPSHAGGVALVAYEVWVDDGAGDFGGSADPAVTTDADASSEVLSGLVTGGTYGIRMKVTNLIGASEYSDVVYLVCAGKPSAPGAPSAESSTRSSITLAWNEPADDGESPTTGYSVYMNELAVGDWGLLYVGEGYPTRQSHTVEGLEEGQSYRFMVSAHNLVGESANSTEAIFTASDFPGGPSQPQLVSSTAEEVVIAWLPPADNGGQSIIAYEVHHKLANEPESSWAEIATITDINALEYTHAGLSATADVQYRIRAQSGKGLGPFSIRNTFVLASAPTIAAAPARLTSTRSSVTVTWQLTSDGGSPITGYRLYQVPVRTGTEVLVYDGAGIPTVSSTRVEDLEEGEYYQYRVSAINRAGEGAKSPLSAQFIAAQLPARGAIPAFVAASSSEIALSFEPASDNGGSAIIEYNLYAAVATSDGATPETYIELDSYDGLSMDFVLEAATESS